MRNQNLINSHKYILSLFMSIAIFIDKTRANLRPLNDQLANKNILIFH